MNKQEKMKQALSRTGIPAKEIKCYGSQIMITVAGKESADKWQMTLNNFCRRVLVKPTMDYAKENVGSCLNPTMVDVYRVWGTI
jgi:hypothetical protein